MTMELTQDLEHVDQVSWIINNKFWKQLPLCPKWLETLTTPNHCACHRRICIWAKCRKPRWMTRWFPLQIVYFVCSLPNYLIKMAEMIKQSIPAVKLKT